MEKAISNLKNRQHNYATIQTSEINQNGKCHKQTKVFIGVRTVRTLEQMGITISWFDEWFDEEQIKLIPNPVDGQYALLKGSRLTLNHAFVKEYKVKDGKYKMTLFKDGSIVIDLTQKVGAKNA